jgi:hypothetical protein
MNIIMHVPVVLMTGPADLLSTYEELLMYEVKVQTNQISYTRVSEI